MPKALLTLAQSSNDVHHFIHGGVRVFHAESGVAMSFETELVFVVVFFEGFEDGFPIHFVGAVESVGGLELDVQNAVFGNQCIAIRATGFL